MTDRRVCYLPPATACSILRRTALFSVFFALEIIVEAVHTFFVTCSVQRHLFYTC